MSQRERQRWSKVCPNIPLTGQSLNRQLEKLKDSKFNTPEYLEAISQKFDEGVKRVFSTSTRHSNQYIKFGTLRDNEPSVGIKAGKLTLTG